jgi:hypothetical protein
VLHLYGCATVNDGFNPAKNTSATDKSGGDFWLWQRERRQASLPKRPEKLTEVVAPDLKFVSANNGKMQEPAIT